MAARSLLVGSVLIAGLALLFTQLSPSPSPKAPFVVGRNNTVLFFTNSESGLSNVHLATTHALLEQHPQIDIHYASFAPLAPLVQRLSSYKSPAARAVTFHEVPGTSLTGAAMTAGKKLSNSMQPPGRAGIDSMCRDLQLYMSPWSGAQHLDLYREMRRIIDEVDPALVVLDTLLAPAIDATRESNRFHAIITPNTLLENFIADQPWGAMLWKYPAMGSGFSYPVPLRNIPENIYLNIRVIIAAIYAPALHAKHKFLKLNGVANPTTVFNLHRPDVPWITQTLASASRPVDVIPPNVTCTGPMTLSVGKAEEQDPVLAAWIARAPTVLVNLGSSFWYPEPYAKAMAAALAQVLQQSNVQVLWKFRKDDENGVYNDDFLAPLQSFLDNGRLKMDRWLTIDPTALLESGHIVASVHHGGSGCYHEAVSAGVPSLILPMWLDLYTFAQLAEDIGVGVWGCRGVNPAWETGCLVEGLLKIVDGGEISQSLREKASMIGEIAQRDPGKYVAASAIAKLAMTEKAEAGTQN